MSSCISKPFMKTWKNRLPSNTNVKSQQSPLRDHTQHLHGLHQPAEAFLDQGNTSSHAAFKIATNVIFPHEETTLQSIFDFERPPTQDNSQYLHSPLAAYRKGHLWFSNPESHCWTPWSIPSSVSASRSHSVEFKYKDTRLATAGWVSDLKSLARVIM